MPCHHSERLPFNASFRDASKVAGNGSDPQSTAFTEAVAEAVTATLSKQIEEKLNKHRAQVSEALPEPARRWVATARGLRRGGCCCAAAAAAAAAAISLPSPLAPLTLARASRVAQLEAILDLQVKGLRAEMQEGLATGSLSTGSEQSQRPMRRQGSTLGSKAHVRGSSCGPSFSRQKSVFSMAAQADAPAAGRAPSALAMAGVVPSVDEDEERRAEQELKAAEEEQRKHDKKLKETEKVGARTRAERARARRLHATPSPRKPCEAIRSHARPSEAIRSHPKRGRCIASTESISDAA